MGNLKKKRRKKIAKHKRKKQLKLLRHKKLRPIPVVFVLRSTGVGRVFFSGNRVFHSPSGGQSESIDTP